jgi:hypothetical protein
MKKTREQMKMMYDTFVTSNVIEKKKCLKRKGYAKKHMHKDHRRAKQRRRRNRKSLLTKLT